MRLKKTQRETFRIRVKKIDSKNESFFCESEIFT
jgi:hypothetical protein